VVGSSPSSTWTGWGSQTLWVSLFFVPGHRKAGTGFPGSSHQLRDLTRTLTEEEDQLQSLAGYASPLERGPELRELPVM
jgi:hypothetical protein